MDGSGPEFYQRLLRLFRFEDLIFTNLEDLSGLIRLGFRVYFTG